MKLLSRPDEVKLTSTESPAVFNEQGRVKKGGTPEMTAHLSFSLKERVRLSLERGARPALNSEAKL